MENFSIHTIVDFLIIGLISFKILQKIKGSRAMSIFLGLVLLAVTLFLSNILKLHWTYKLLSYCFDHSLLIIIVLFQEEIRRTLAEFGRKASGLTSKSKKTRSAEEIADVIAQVATQMGKDKIGALIVLEKEDKLQNIIDTGSTLYSQIRPEIISAIFLKDSPIHDGAVVISNGELAAAGCYLPLSKNTSLNKKYGTRHRSAVGITEETDAIVVVVSEETGAVSLVKSGKINSHLTELELKEILVILQEKEDGAVNEFWIKIKKVTGFLKTKINDKVKNIRLKNKKDRHEK